MPTAGGKHRCGAVLRGRKYKVTNKSEDKQNTRYKIPGIQTAHRDKVNISFLTLDDTMTVLTVSSLLSPPAGTSLGRLVIAKAVQSGISRHIHDREGFQRKPPRVRQQVAATHKSNRHPTPPAFFSLSGLLEGTAKKKWFAHGAALEGALEAWLEARPEKKKMEGAKEHPSRMDHVAR